MLLLPDRSVHTVYRAPLTGVVPQRELPSHASCLPTDIVLSSM